MKNLGLRLTVTVIALCLVSAAIGCQSPAPAVPVPTPSLPAVASPALSPTPAPSLPEFKVTSLSVEPKEAVAGGNVTIKARVENTGKGEGTYRAAPTVNGKIVETRDVPLTAGARQDLSFKVTTDAPGTYIITLGELTDMLKVLKSAKFRLASLDISPKLVKTGENVTVNINLINEGEAQGTYSLSLMLDGKVIETKDVASGGGARQQVNFTIGQNSLGIHNIEIGDQKGVVRAIDYLKPTTGTYLLGKMDPRPSPTHLLVKNESDLDAVFVLTRSLTPEKPEMAVYIQSHDRYQIYVIGNDFYHVFYTLGKNWDNYTKEFATDRYFLQAGKSNFYQYYWEIRFTGPGAGKGIELCKDEDFPKLKWVIIIGDTVGTTRLASFILCPVCDIKIEEKCKEEYR